MDVDKYELGGWSYSYRFDKGSDYERSKNEILNYIEPEFDHSSSSVGKNIKT